MKYIIQQIEFSKLNEICFFIYTYNVYKVSLDVSLGNINYVFTFCFVFIISFTNKYYIVINSL